MAKPLCSRVSMKKEMVPTNYLIPPERSPKQNELVYVPTDKQIVPTIDLHDENNPVHHILKAAQDFGMFQVINHGIPKELLSDAMKVFKEFFELPIEEKLKLYSEEMDAKCRFFTSSHSYATEDVHFWRDCLKHTCAPNLNECMACWPQNPTKYKEIVGELSEKMKDLGSRILNKIGEGLGLEEGYFEKGLSSEASLSISQYPRCPDPTLTLGLPKHYDFNLLTLILQEEVAGLQTIVDGKWHFVNPNPDAFVVVIGYELQIVSNDKLKGGEHRVVTNSKSDRISAGMFIKPLDGFIIEPAKSLITANDPPHYKPVKDPDFFKTTLAYKHNESLLETYKANV